MTNEKFDLTTLDSTDDATWIPELVEEIKRLRLSCPKPVAWYCENNYFDSKNEAQTWCDLYAQLAEEVTPLYLHPKTPEIIESKLSDCKHLLIKRTTALTKALYKIEQLEKELKSSLARERELNVIISMF